MKDNKCLAGNNMDCSIRFKFHYPITHREQGVVVSNAHKLPRMKPGSTLPDNDTARANLLPAKNLDAQTLGL